MLALVGVGTRSKTWAASSLLQRIIHDEALARVLGVMWGMAMAGAAIGLSSGRRRSTPPGFAGRRGDRPVPRPGRRALVAPARLARPGGGSVTQELDALDKVPIFRSLSVVAKERRRRAWCCPRTRLERQPFARARLVTRFYIVVDGEIEATEQGRPAGKASLDYSGKIALPRDIRRNATMTAMTAVRLYALERDDFLER